MVEALGLRMPHNAAIPAVDSRRYVLAHLAGRRIVEMVREDLRISKILTREAFENAIRVNGAVGGSTNAVIHLIAIAGRIGVKVTLDDWDRLGHERSHAGGPDALRPLPHGRFLLRRWRSRSHSLARRTWPHRQECSDGERENDLGKLRRCAQLEPGSDSSFRQAAGQHMAASRYCAAILRPMAPCSSLPPHRRT